MTPNQIAVVTGGNSGIGYEMVLQLLRHNAKVYLAARNKTKAEKAMDELKGKPGVKGILTFVQLDLSDMRSIESFAGEMKERESHIDYLFNNAGIMEMNVRILDANKSATTAQGYEQHVGVNGIGSHYVAKLLIPLLQAATASHPDSLARVIFTSSCMHANAPAHGFDPEDPYGEKDVPPETSMPMRHYGVSKFYNILCESLLTATRKLQRDHDDIIFTAVHPGFVRTPIIGNPSGLIGLYKRYIKFPLLTLPQNDGAVTSLMAAFADVGLKKGAYFVPYGRECATISAGYDHAVQDACAYLLTVAEWCDAQISKHAA